MSRWRVRASGVTLLAAAALVLLPALAWLQYSWLDQIAEADRERRTRILQSAVTQLVHEFHGELSKVVSSLQIDATTAEQQAWSVYGDRYQAWVDSAAAPGIVDAVYYIEAPLGGSKPSSTATLHRWNPHARSFEVREWPIELAHLKMLSSESGRVFGGRAALGMLGLGGEGGIASRGPLLDERTIVVPLTRARLGQPGSPALSSVGFTVIRLNDTALGRDLLPVLVRRHLFEDREEPDYLVAVVSQNDPGRVIYESAEGAATATLAAPEASVPLLVPHVGSLLLTSNARHDPSAKQRVVVSVIETRRSGGAPSVARVGMASEGQWRLLVKHRSGALEAAVTSARTRNVALSFGILLLLTGAIGLIVVSARRADRLARQQLDFVAAVSHELRTPVSVISAAAENLADGLVDEHARVQKYGETIQVEARRLAETVERVLQMAGIASGRTAVARAPIAPSALVKDAIAASRRDIDRAKASVQVDVPPDLPAINGDATTLRVAIQNLIGNALKYGGESPVVRVAAAAQNGHIRIAVEDRGFGIEADDLAHIFEPFYRGRQALSLQIQGSGLGLHLARRIVESHGGSISVQSQTGRGSTFTIELPASSERG